MQHGDDKQRRTQRIMQIVTDEAMEELSAEVDQQKLQLWLIYTARITEWAATGDIRILPPELLPFACAVEGVSYDDLMRARAAAEETPAEIESSDDVVYAGEIVQ